MKITSIFAYEQMSGSLFIGCLAIGAWTDLSLAASLIFLLVKRGHGGMAGTWNVVRRVIVYSLSTCTLCLCLALAGMITRATMPTSQVWGLLAQLLNPCAYDRLQPVSLTLTYSSVYLNSVLGALNSRASASGHQNSSVVMSTEQIQFASTQSHTANNHSHLEMGGSFGSGGRTFFGGSRTFLGSGEKKGRALDVSEGKVFHITQDIQTSDV